MSCACVYSRGVSSHQIPAVTRRLIYERDSYCCALCGLDLQGGYIPASIHHRSGRGAGGDRLGISARPSNLVLLDGTGTTGCHGRVTANPVWAHSLGWIVRRNGIAVPSEVPVLYRNTWMLLDDLGGITPV